MPNRIAASIARWLFCCALVVASSSHAQDQPTQSKTVVQIEFWMAEVDFAKLRSLDLTCEHLDADGHSHRTKIIDCLDGKEEDMPLLQRPEELLTLLRKAGVARVLSQPTIKTLSGRKASFEVGGSKLDATAQVKDDGQIYLDIQAEHNEPMNFNRRRTPPGNSQRVMSFSVKIESGKTGLINPIGQGIAVYLAGKPSPPPPAIIAFVRATVDKPTGSEHVALATATASPLESSNVMPATADLKSVTIHLTVVQVNRDKLKKLGFEWSQLTPDGPKQFSVETITPLINDRRISADEFNRFLKSLHQNGVARVIAEPTLITLDGRKASFTSGRTNIDFIPTLLPDERAKLECHLKSGSSLELTASDELELGRTCSLRGPAIHEFSVGPQSTGTETVILARVDLLKPGQISNIVGPPTYIEVRGQSK